MFEKIVSSASDVVADPEVFSGEGLPAVMTSQNRIRWHNAFELTKTGVIGKE